MNDIDEVLLGGLDALRARNLEWIQLDVAAGSTAAAVAGALAPLWPTFGPRRWWFVRKDPGMRVRIELAGADHHTLLTASRAVLELLGPVAAGIYEPEVYRFGGVSGMDVAHDHFALDTALAALLGRSRTLPLTPRQWSVAALGDLSTRVIDDPAERWDAWKRLEEVLAALGSPSHRQHTVTAGAAAVPRRVVDALHDGNERIAARLRSAPLAHGVGRRTWFAGVAVFHWNRLGFGPPAMTEVIGSVLHGTGPR